MQTLKSYFKNFKDYASKIIRNWPTLSITSPERMLNIPLLFVKKPDEDEDQDEDEDED
jgi:hypothetical protein